MSETPPPRDDREQPAHHPADDGEVAGKVEQIVLSVGRIAASAARTITTLAFRPRRAARILTDVERGGQRYMRPISFVALASIFIALLVRAVARTSQTDPLGGGGDIIGEALGTMKAAQELDASAFSTLVTAAVAGAAILAVSWMGARLLSPKGEIRQSTRVLCIYLQAQVPVVVLVWLELIMFETKLDLPWLAVFTVPFVLYSLLIPPVVAMVVWLCRRLPHEYGGVRALGLLLVPLWAYAGVLVVFMTAFASQAVMASVIAEQRQISVGPLGDVEIRHASDEASLVVLVQNNLQPTVYIPRQGLVATLGAHAAEALDTGAVGGEVRMQLGVVEWESPDRDWLVIPHGETRQARLAGHVDPTALAGVRCEALNLTAPPGTGGTTGSRVYVAFDLTARAAVGHLRVHADDQAMHCYEYPVGRDFTTLVHVAD